MFMDRKFNLLYKKKTNNYMQNGCLKKEIIKRNKIDKENQTGIRQRESCR